VLSRSFEDGTSAGTQTARSFSRVATAVSRILAVEYHARATELQSRYERLDPQGVHAQQQRPRSGVREGSSMGTRPAVERGAVQLTAVEVAEAARFRSLLHQTMCEAGFDLCSGQEETFGSRDHFGDESIWNVPVEMQWDALDCSRRSEARGGFDPYAAEAARGRTIERPHWAEHLSVYMRGEGVVEKRGYFVVAKAEEMAWRFLRRRASAAVDALAAMEDRLSQKLAAALGALLRQSGAKLLGKAGAVLRERAIGAGLLAEAPGGAATGKRTLGDGGAAPLPAAAPAKLEGSTFGSMRLGWRELLEESVLKAPAYGHVLLIFRHVDASQHANGLRNHVALGLYRQVPKLDLDLLLPHQQVAMPPLQRAQFIAFGSLGLAASWPLLFFETLSTTGILTLYAMGVLAVRTAVRWRATKQLYQQLLVSYQSANRLGTADDALLYLVRMAEVEQTKQALLALHALVSQQGERRSAVGGERQSAVGASTVDGLPLSALEAHSERLLRDWSELLPFGRAYNGGASSAMLKLERIGLVQMDPSDSKREQLDRDQHVRMVPLEQATEHAARYWADLLDDQRGGAATLDMELGSDLSTHSQARQQRPLESATMQLQAKAQGLGRRFLHRLAVT